jgi:hypothetical protein
MRYPRPSLSLLLVLAALVPGCSNNTPSTPSGVTRAVITVAVDPNPPQATLSTTALGYLHVRFNVVIKELAGLGGEFVFVNSTIFDQASGLSVAVNNYDSADLLVFVGSKRIEGSQTVTISQQLDYLLPTGNTDARLTVNVQLRDDVGNVLNQSILVSILPPPV